MKIGTLGKTLILLSVMILLYALNMAVAMPGSDIVNIHLISERQNMIIIGSMFFIGGIILFSVGKLKQTDDENAKEKYQKIKNTEKEQELENMHSHSMRSETTILSSIVSLWRRFFVGPDDGVKSISVRLAIGVCVGVIATLAVHYFSRKIVDWTIADTTNANNLLKIRLVSWSENLSMLAFVLLALRAGPILNALKHVFLVGLTIILIAVAHYIAVKGGSSLSLSIYGSIAFLAVGVIIIVVLQRKQMSE